MAKKKANERLEEKQKRQKLIVTGVLAVAALIILAAGFILLNGQSANSTSYNQSTVDVSGQNVLIPVSDLADNNFHFYSYNSSGTVIKYMVIKDKNGVIHTAFDACDVCYKTKKGYHQSGEYAQCNNCGKTFSIYDIGTKNTAGGCWPGYLQHSIQGNNVVIKNSDLESGKYYFQ